MSTTLPFDIQLPHGNIVTISDSTSNNSEISSSQNMILNANGNMNISNSGSTTVQSTGNIQLNYDSNSTLFSSSGVSLGSQNITTSHTPVSNTDLCNKLYVDSAVGSVSTDKIITPTSGTVTDEL